MKRESFVLYTEYRENIEMLNMKQRGVLLTNIMKYSQDEQLLEMDAVTSMAFSFIKKKLDKDNEKYERTCVRNRQNIESRWKGTNSSNNDENIPNDTKNIPNDTKNTTGTFGKNSYSDNEYDYESDNDLNLKEEENKEEEKSSSSLDCLNEEMRAFVGEFNIVIDGYNGNIQALDFSKIRKAFKESAWLRQNITSLKKVCEIYPKIESGYYKDYVGVGEIIIPQDEWFKVEKVLTEMMRNSSDYNPNYESYKDYKAKQDSLYGTLSEDVRAYYGDYGGFVSLFEYKSLENEKARFIRDFEKFCQKRRMKNAQG